MISSQEILVIRARLHGCPEKSPARGTQTRGKEARRWGQNSNAPDHQTRPAPPHCSNQKRGRTKHPSGCSRSPKRNGRRVSGDVQGRCREFPPFAEALARFVSSSSRSPVAAFELSNAP